MPGVFGNLRSMDTVTALGWTPEPAVEPEAGTTGPGETYFPLDRSGAALRRMGIGRFRDQLCDATSDILDGSFARFGPAAADEYVIA